MLTWWVSFFLLRQRKLDALMKGTPLEEGSADTDAEGLDIFTQEQWASLRLDAAAMRLRPEEQLQVHMDCLNAVGEIVTIEDVDDMGGSVSTMPLLFSLRLCAY